MMKYDREQLVIARDILQSFNKSVGWIDVEIDKIDNPPDPQEDLKQDLIAILEYGDKNRIPISNYAAVEEIIRTFKKSPFWKDPEDAEVGW